MVYYTPIKYYIVSHCIVLFKGLNCLNVVQNDNHGNFPIDSQANLVNMSSSFLVILGE